MIVKLYSAYILLMIVLEIFCIMNRQALTKPYAAGVLIRSDLTFDLIQGQTMMVNLSNSYILVVIFLNVRLL